MEKVRYILSYIYKRCRTRSFILFLGILLSAPICSAQSFTRCDSIPVTIAGNTIKNPWAGGFNNPQFSDIDLNGDGIKDLFVFDRDGNRIITFINNGTPNTVDYKHAPEYQSKFPELRGWALLVDYNGDGKKDIFTSTYLGVKVYRNDYNITSGLNFTLVTPLLYADGQFIYISEWDIPAIKDVDGDGDVDILTFEFSGSLMEYFKNLSFENYGILDSLSYTLQDTCWGKFEEDWGNCSVTLDTCGAGKTGKKLHAGSTTLALDLDCDNDMEVIIGDVTCTKSYMLSNGGDSINALMSTVTTSYPTNYPVDISRFPAAFFVDVNNDGLRDLLAAPNGVSISENFTCSWYYKNTNTDCSPYFTYQTNTFLQDGMIEVGAGANPTFFDYNNDSLLDIVIGNYGYYSNASQYTSGLSLYENIGTASSPVFKLITRDYANLNTYGFLGVYPTFGDVDNDGDKDMIIGESEGNLHFFLNNAPIGSPANFILAQAYYKAIDIGQYSTPQLVDVNCNGLLDLLIGEKSGVINFYKNTGSNTVADYTLISDSTGGVDVKKSGDLTGYSSPFLTVLDSSGESVLLVGSESGYIYQYKNINNDLSGIFTLVDTLFSNIREGERASLSGSDVNNDGTIDLLVGNYGGGIALFTNNGFPTPQIICPPPITPIPPLTPFSVTIYPNPTYNNLNINIEGSSEGDVAEVSIYNAIGQQILDNKYIGNLENIAIKSSTFANGIYVCKLKVISAAGLPDEFIRLKFSVIR